MIYRCLTLVVCAVVIGGYTIPGPASAQVTFDFSAAENEFLMFGEG